MMQNNKTPNLESYLNKQFLEQNKTIECILNNSNALTVSEKHNYTTETELVKSKSLSANDLYKFHSVKGTGIIDQIFIYNDQNDYKIRITIDDKQIYDGDTLFSWFQTYDDWLTNISAFASGSYYVFSARNLYFSKKFMINITSGTATTLTVALVRYTIRDGRETI